MLYRLAELLAPHYTGFRVFSYLTLRGILAAITALMIALLVGPYMIRTLATRQIGQHVRDLGPKSHLSKQGTPTMGGALILVAMLASTLLWADLGNRYVWIVVGVTLAFGLIGFYDDYLKLVVGNSKGLAARWKYLLQSIAGLSAAIALYFSAPRRLPPSTCTCRSSRTSRYRSAPSASCCSVIWSSSGPATPST